MSRCCLAHSVITYLIRLLNSSPTTISKTSFINNSASEWVNSGETIAFSMCSFTSISKNPSWTSNYNFNNCNFDQKEPHYGIPPHFLINCIFSLESPNQYKPEIMFQCFGIRNTYMITRHPLLTFIPVIIFLV